MTAMMMTMPYLGCVVVSSQSCHHLLRSTKVNGGGGDKSDGLMRSEVSRVRITLSPRRSHSTSLTNTTLYDSVSPDSAGERVVGGHETHNKNYVYVDIKYFTDAGL
jgi:hypothetical protein